MPKIEAETVLAHRALRERQLLDAAEHLLLDQGYRGLTFTALSKVTGLARNSLYEYFASRDELVAAVCERELSRWTGPVQAAVAACSEPGAQLVAYVDAQLDLVEQGRHQLATVLAGAPLAPEARERIRSVHHVWLKLAINAAAVLRHPHPEVAARLVQGLVDAATAQLHAGADPQAVRASLHDLLSDGLGVPDREGGATRVDTAKTVRA